MENIVYAKSNKGQQEIQQRSAGLKATLRRVLLLIDGKRACAELLDFVRPGELRVLLAELLRDGFIEPLEELADTDPRLAAWPRTADDETHFSQVQRRTVIHLHKCLGMAALPAIDRVQAANDPLTMRRALRDIEPIIAGMTGQAEAREFCRQVGRAIMRKIEADALNSLQPKPQQLSSQIQPQKLQELTTTGKVRALESAVDLMLAEAALRQPTRDKDMLGGTMRIVLGWRDRLVSAGGTAQRGYQPVADR